MVFKQKIFAVIWFCAFVQIAWAQTIAKEVIPVGHSHNDYTRKKPLFDALENGFCSVEIDVFAYKNQLVVSHIPLALFAKPTIEDLYLKPLAKILSQQKWIYSNYKKPLVLMIDCKTDVAKTYHLLKEILAPYQKYFVHWNEKGELSNAPLQIVLSGAKPINEVLAEKESFFFIDGKVSACEQEKTFVFVRGSAHYKKRFAWKGKKSISAEDLALLQQDIAQAKLCGKKIRYWAMPENEQIWQLFLAQGVAWINVDNLARFRAFYLKQNL